MAGRTRKVPAKEKKPVKPRLQFAEPAGVEDTRLEMIQTEEADNSLQEFPDILRQKLEEYLRLNGDNLVDFTAGGASTFRLHSFADGQPARFVIPGTTEALDAAVYRYGMRKKHRNIIVVQSKARSIIEFNNGEPAIISYFGKGKKGESTSRYAIWGPEGYRRDMFVDRIRHPPSVTSATPVLSREEGDKSSSPVTARNNGAASLQYLYPSDDSDVPDQIDEANFLPGVKNSLPSDSEDGWGASIPGNSGIDINSKSNRGRSSSISKFRSSSTASPSPYKLPKSMKGSYKRTHSTVNATDTDCDDDVKHRSKSQRVEKSPLTPVSASFPSTACDDLPGSTMLRFKANLKDESWRLSKDVRQCNDVHKLFAYARIAKISDNTHAMLSASFTGGEMIDIVRDDDQTFEDFLIAIREKRGNDNTTVEIMITPAQY